ncbi:MAG: pyridoxal phosphate-dependent aminotransferase [Thermoleophilia bacterium]
MKTQVRSWMAGLSPYVPGRPVSTEPGRLASNESPFPASSGVSDAAVAALAGINRYPDPLATALRERLGERLAVDPDQILVGNGSDELIFLLVMAYAAGGGGVVIADPPYRVDEVVAQSLGARVERVPLAGWTHDLGAMAAVHADLYFVCNPHNPTGTTVSREAVATLVDEARAGLVVVDEAYVDFADDPAAITALPLAVAGEAVVVRTFSKLYGLAGLRIGYLVGPAGVVEDLRRVRLPFSVNALAQAAAEAALKDNERTEEVRRTIVARRAHISSMFTSRGYATVPSQANFVLVLCRDEDALVAGLLQRGISVRPGSSLGMPGSARISVPSAEGLALLERALDEIGPEDQG